MRPSPFLFLPFTASLLISCTKIASYAAPDGGAVIDDASVDEDAGGTDSGAGDVGKQPGAFVDGGGVLPAPRESRLAWRPECDATCSDPDCLSANEVQGIENWHGRLYVATTVWEETAECIWPSRSAPILVQNEEDGPWAAMPSPPVTTGVCAEGFAPWEQINSLLAYTFGSVDSLFAATFPNEDGGCPGLEGSVFEWVEGASDWVDTGLATKIDAYYGGRQAEIRYVTKHADGTADCPEERPCVFALVGPREFPLPFRGPSVWRAVVDGDCGQSLCWDDAAEVELDGVDFPFGSRLVSAFDDGADGLLVGSGMPSIANYDRYADRCTDPSSNGCPTVSVLRRLAGSWSVVWRGQPIPKHPAAEREVRGLYSVPGDGLDGALLMLTLKRGRLQRLQGDTVSLDITMGDLVAADGPFYGYELLSMQLSSGREVLLAPGQFRDQMGEPQRAGRIAYRCLDEGPSAWSLLEIPELVDSPDTARANEAATRWLHPSPWRTDTLFVGTGDMNSGPGSRAGRLLEVPVAALCP